MILDSWACRRAVSPAVVLATALLLSACGGSGDEPNTPAPLFAAEIDRTRSPQDAPAVATPAAAAADAGFAAQESAPATAAAPRDVAGAKGLEVDSERKVEDEETGPRDPARQPQRAGYLCVPAEPSSTERCN